MATFDGSLIQQILRPHILGEAISRTQLGVSRLQPAGIETQLGQRNKQVLVHGSLLSSYAFIYRGR
jgi:hypothetical protein